MTRPAEPPRRSPLRGLVIGLVIAVVFFPAARHAPVTTAGAVVAAVGGAIFMGLLLSGRRR